MMNRATMLPQETACIYYDINRRPRGACFTFGIYRHMLTSTSGQSGRKPRFPVSRTRHSQGNLSCITVYSNIFGAHSQAFSETRAHLSAFLIW